VSRTFYARGQTGQQLLLGAYSHLARTIAEGKVELHERCEMIDLIVEDNRARGIVTRDLVTGKIEVHLADAVVLATGGYGNVFYLSTNAKGCNATAIWRAHRRGALFANPCFTQIHPTCIPQAGEYQSKLTLMSESLRNDGRVWVPRKREDCTRDPASIPEKDRFYYLEEKYPAFGNLMPRDIASRQAKFVCDQGLGVGPEIHGVRRGVYLDFADAIKRDGKQAIAERYGNLFDMYQRITGEDPYRVPMRIYPATHYTMGGLWVDYNLMSNIPGLFVAGEANFSDHGANRLGASALMQGLADGFFILPYVLGNYLAQAGKSKTSESSGAVTATLQEAQAKFRRLVEIGQKGSRTVDDFHRKLGTLIWDNCGMARDPGNLKNALKQIPELREEFYRDVKITGSGEALNRDLEKAGRVADFFELGELMCRDALERDESCGCHFREDHQADGECVRDDGRFAHVAAWEWRGQGPEARDGNHARHREELSFEYVKMAQRSYK
jgi:succinate dehydrogenase / fumarate reductase flavoprotein subunit